MATIEQDPGLVPSQIPRFERFKIVFENFGFMPASTRELQEAFYLSTFIDEPGGTARHLNEVLLHQQKIEKSEDEEARRELAPNAELIDGAIDPTAAVRSKSRLYSSYYENAVSGFCDVSDLAQKAAYVDNPKLLLLEEFSDDPAIPFIAQFRILAGYLEHESAEVGLKQEVANDEGVLSEAAHAMVDGVTIRDLRTLLPEVAAGQLARAQFWEQRLIEARSHNEARPIVDEVLQKHSSVLE